MAGPLVAVVRHEGPLLKLDRDLHRLRLCHVPIVRILIEVSEGGGGGGGAQRSEKEGGNNRGATGRATQGGFPGVKTA